MRFCFTLFFVVIMPFGALLEKRLDGSDEEIIKVVTNYGYPIETHQVETEDGYILTVFRIPHGKNTNKTSGNPILLNHGMLGSSENFILLGPKKSLAYILADGGYDVWMMNCRGTWHSKNHKTLKPDQKAFWQFSWHEIGVYDIPAVIDHMLTITNQTGLYYVGHSQGCTSLFVMGSERPEYNDKIKVMIGLGPGAIYKNFKQPYLKLAAANYKLIQKLLDLMDIHQVPPPFLSDEDVRDILNLLCVENRALKNTCTTLFMLLTEANPETFDTKTLPSIFPIVPGSASTKQIFHYCQLITSGNFQQYDWGPEINMRKYGMRTPPLYNLKNVTFPVALFVGKGDMIVSSEDVQLLAKELPNVAIFYEVPLESFNHLDFITAKNGNTLVYGKALKVMRKYKNR